MKTSLFTICLLLISSISFAQKLDETSAASLEKRKQKAKENNTIFWKYDTVYKAGTPYCLLESRSQSENGNEYMVKGLNGKDLIYVKEPGNIEKLLSNLSLKANVEFSFLNEKQKLDVPKKSVGQVYSFIVKNNLVTENKANMKAAKNLLYIHSEENPQGYTANVKVEDTDSTASEEKTVETPEKAKDTAAYQPVARDKGAINTKNYIIKQSGVIIGRYDKRTISDGLSDPITRFTIKSPDWKEIILVTNRGFGSTTWDIEILTTGKKDVFTTESPIHRKAFKEVVWYLIDKKLL